jgi:hypothetical protein
MIKLRITAAFFFFLFIACNKKTEDKIAAIKTQEKPALEIVTEKISKANLPKEIVFEGNLKEISKLKDAAGEHIVLLTETGETPSKKIADQDDATDFKIFAYDYLFDKTENKYKINWKTYDFITNCQFDLSMGFLEKTFQTTDLNKNGIAEVWTMYAMTCTSDVSPKEMKIIMHEGKTKFALRGESLLIIDTEKMGGNYTFDENFTKAPKEFKAFALKMWNENNLQKYE